MDKLTNEMIISLANDLSLEPALLKAVILVEGAGRDGFLPSGKPQILFEGHIMFSELKKKFGLAKAVEANKANPNIVFPRWDRSKYKGGELEYPRLELAKKIDEECALKSASWGMFQIMGFNFKYCGCRDVFEFVEKMSRSHEMQLRMMYYFMTHTNCLKPLREKDWATFARRYNGPGYAQNAYDQKLMNAYENFKKNL